MSFSPSFPTCVFLAAVACNGGIEPIETGAADTDTDADSDADTDADSDADVDTDLSDDTIYDIQTGVITDQAEVRIGQE